MSLRVRRIAAPFLLGEATAHRIPETAVRKPFHAPIAGAITWEGSLAVR